MFRKQMMPAAYSKHYRTCLITVRNVPL